jgi:hypothetical protein
LGVRQACILATHLVIANAGIFAAYNLVIANGRILATRLRPRCCLSATAEEQDHHTWKTPKMILETAQGAED